MIRALLLLGFLGVPAPGAETAQEIFNSVRTRVIQQLQQAQNYTCVQTTEREYYRDHGRRSACLDTPILSRELVMEDRLRIDVAVSSAGEIYGWHGAQSFSSERVEEVVRNGPISSGSFTGYLRNILFIPEVHMAYVRPAQSGLPFQFRYVVPLAASHEYVFRTHKEYLTAFHGELTVDPATRELSTLSVVLDQPPARSHICRSSTYIDYQTVDISGVPSRIPKRFTLEMDDDTGTHTVSRTDYQSCRAFRGESKVSFEAAPDTAQPANLVAAPTVETIRPGTLLPLTINTKIDDRTSYAGDPVTGTLTSDVRSGKTRIPKGSAVEGVITQLEHRLRPEETWIVNIRIFRIHDSSRLFLTDALPTLDNRNLIWHDRHVRWPEHFYGNWQAAAIR